MFESDFWTITNIATIITTIAALTGLALAYWPIHRQKRVQHLLEKSFGADFYDSATIARSTRYYVRPYCSSVDPAQEAEIRQVITTQENLFSVIDKHLADGSTYRHILLLADSGMGKSSFVLNYYARNQKLPNRKRQRLAVVPLGIPHAIDEIIKIDNKKNTVIFLDAFDEDTKAIQDHRARLIELMQACYQFKRVLITCRTQFFPKDEEIPRETGIARVAPRKPGEPGTYEFWKLYLSPLTDDQVKKFLWRRFPFRSRRKRKEALNLVNKIPLLSVRPMLLSYIPDVLESGERINYAYQLYEIMVEKWLERESRWIDKAVLLSFSEQLAVDLYVNRQTRGSERISKSELSSLIKQYNLSLEEWKITGRSLLNRDALGNYKFAHRSIMEYLFVKKFTLGDASCQGIEWTDYMKRFLIEMILYHYETAKKVPFSIEGADLRNLGYISPLYLLRSEPLDILQTKTNRLIRPIIKRIADTDSTLHLYALHDQAGDIVRDFATGLFWQRVGSRKPLTFSEAKNYIEDLNRAGYGGYNDWRLPTLEEALLLFDFKPIDNPDSDNLTGEVTFNPLFSRMLESIWTADESTNVAGVIRLRGAKTFHRWLKGAAEGARDKRERFRVLPVRSF